MIWITPGLTLIFFFLAVFFLSAYLDEHKKRKSLEEALIAAAKVVSDQRERIGMYEAAEHLRVKIIRLKMGHALDDDIEQMFNDIEEGE